MASQKQLESTRITRKGHSITQVPAPTSTMVAAGKQCAPRSTIKHALQIFTDASKEGCCSLLSKHTARGTWSLTIKTKKNPKNYLKLKAVFLALKEFQDLCSNKIVLVATDNTAVVSCINTEGDMRPGPICAYCGVS